MMKHALKFCFKAFYDWFDQYKIRSPFQEKELLRKKCQTRAGGVWL